ncbi:MAG: hypothetical protein WBQ69_08440 [Gallionella sp.]
MSVAQTIIPIFLLILPGAAMRRRFGLGEGFWPQMDRRIYYVFFPALLFSALAHFEIDLRAAMPMLAVAALFMCSGIVMGYGAKYLFHAPPKVCSATFQTFFRFNSYVGLAIGLLMGFIVPLANAASVLMLARHIKSHWRGEILFNPLIIATVRGIEFSLAGIPLPKMFDTSLGLLAEASLPLTLPLWLLLMGF